MQRSYFSSTLSGQASFDERESITHCVREMVERVGLGPDVVQDAVEREMSASFPQFALDQLQTLGVTLKGARLLDLGAGLGSCAIEASRRGAMPLAVEPGEGWRDLAARRLRDVGPGVVVAGTGESIPARSGSVDIVVSLMVLEHVSSPRDVIREAFRVLKPGGVFFLACENYLSFRENHYRVAWLPLLPKPIGAAYLRLRGRPTKFLYESVTYTTRPQVTRLLREAGFESMRRQRIARLVSSPDGITSAPKRFLVEWALRVLTAPRLADVLVRSYDLRHLCAGLICEVLQKPDETSRPPQSDRRRH